MRSAWLFLHFATVLFAADPPYFAADIEGYYISDLVNREKSTFVVGTLSGCSPGFSSPTYSSSDCGLADSEMRVTVGGKTVAFSFNRLNVTEYQSDPKLPSTITYNLSGKSTETLPNGMELESNTNLYFTLRPEAPDEVRARFSLSNLNLNGTFVASTKPMSVAPAKKP